MLVYIADEPNGPRMHMNREPFDPVPTRHSLLDRLKDWDDQTSWQEFFDTYSRLLYNVATKSGLTDMEAQEVVQETVIAVAKNIPTFKTDPNRGSFSGWLMKLTRWRIADQFRKRHRAIGPQLALDGGQVLADNSDPADPTHRIADPAGEQLEALWRLEWEENLLAAALAEVKVQVSPRQFQIFDLHVLQGLSSQDTARILKVSVPSVYMAKSRISRMLKRTVSALRRKMH